MKYLFLMLIIKYEITVPNVDYKYEISVPNVDYKI